MIRKTLPTLILIIIITSPGFVNAEKLKIGVTETITYYSFGRFNKFPINVSYIGDNYMLIFTDQGTIQPNNTKNNKTITFEYYSFNRTIITMPPRLSAPFVPHYNESMPIPEDLKNITKQIAEKSDTYFEFFINTAWYIHNTIKYSYRSYPQEKIPIFDWENNFTNEKLWDLVNAIWHDKKGVCRHKALIMIAMLKYAGVNAIYVGGYLGLPLTYEKKIKNTLLPVDKIKDSVNSADYIGFGHAWVLAYDPAVGWIPIDPTNMKNQFTYILYQDFADTFREMTEYYPYASMFFPIIDVNVVSTIYGEIHAYYITNTTIAVETKNFGLLIYNNRNNWIDYIPENTVVIINTKGYNYLLKEKLHIKNTTNISAYLIKDKLYIKLDNLQSDFIVLQRAKTTYIGKKNKLGYYVVDKNAILFTNSEQAYVSSGFGTILLDIKHTTPTEIILNAISNNIPEDNIIKYAKTNNITFIPT